MNGKQNSRSDSTAPYFKLVKTGPPPNLVTFQQQSVGSNSAGPSVKIVPRQNPTFFLVPASPASQKPAAPSAPASYIFRLANPVEGTLIPKSKSPAGTQLFTLSRVDNGLPPSEPLIPKGLHHNHHRAANHKQAAAVPLAKIVQKVSQPANQSSSKLVPAAVVFNHPQKSAACQNRNKSCNQSKKSEPQIRDTSNQLFRSKRPKKLSPSPSVGSHQTDTSSTDLHSDSDSSLSADADVELICCSQPQNVKKKGRFALPEEAAVPLLSLIPKQAGFSALWSAFEKSGLKANYSASKEKAALMELLTKKGCYEDSEVVWKSLPAPEPISLPGVPSEKIGDLLAFGRFIEVLQFYHKAHRTKQKRYDFDFIMNAVIAADGQMGPYRSLVNWIVQGFDQRKEVESGLALPEGYGTTIQDMEIDHMLSCEALRQYLLNVKKHKRTQFGSQMVSLMKKLQNVDVEQLSIEERIQFLCAGMNVVVQETGFVPMMLDAFEEERQQLIKERTDVETWITTKELLQQEAEVSLQQVIERSTTRADEREKTKLTGEIESTKRAIISLKDRLVDIEKELKVLAHHSALLHRTEPIGHDRCFNRYWYFPELSADIFVEAGWCQSDSDPSENINAQLVGNFIFPSRPTDLHFIRSNGQTDMCLPEKFVPPRRVPNTWFRIPRKDLPALIAELNPIGVKESQLKEKLSVLIEEENSVSARSQPTVIDDSLQVIKELMMEITSDLMDDQYLKEYPAENWKEELEKMDFEQVKKWIAKLKSNIFKHFIKEKSASFFGSSPDPIEETMSYSRLYYLCKVIDSAVAWEKAADSFTCKSCNRKNSRRKLMRCLKCASTYHIGTCMEFEERICLLCRDKNAQLPVRNGDRSVSLSSSNSSEPMRVTRGAKRKASMGEISMRPTRKLRSNQEKEQSAEEASGSSRRLRSGVQNHESVEKMSGSSRALRSGAKKDESSDDEDEEVLPTRSSRRIASRYRAE